MGASPSCYTWDMPTDKTTDNTAWKNWFNDPNFDWGVGYKNVKLKKFLFDMRKRWEPDMVKRAYVGTRHGEPVWGTNVGTRHGKESRWGTRHGKESLCKAILDYIHPSLYVWETDKINGNQVGTGI